MTIQEIGELVERSLASAKDDDGQDSQGERLYADPVDLCAAWLRGEVLSDG